MALGALGLEAAGKGPGGLLGMVEPKGIPCDAGELAEE